MVSLEKLNSGSHLGNSEIPTGRLGTWRLVALILLFIIPVATHARINPKFTPIDLVGESRLIVSAQLAPDGDAKDTWKLETPELLKGDKANLKKLNVNLVGCNKDQVEQIRRLLTTAPGGENLAVLFTGADRGYLHVAGQWLDVISKDGQAWSITGLALEMSSTISGRTEMLIRCIRYIVGDPQATMPVAVGVAWMQGNAARPLLAKLDGKIAGMAAVRLGEKAELFLFVACEKGDRLFRPKINDEGFTDVTATFKLDTRSRRFAWLDIDGDGQLELGSWDGKSIVLRKLAAAGSTGFQPVGGVSWELPGPVFGLSACHRIADSQLAPPALLVSTPDLPTLLVRGKDAGAAWRQERLPDGPAVAAGQPGAKAAMACIVADLDNDGYWDVLQPRAKAGVLWRGGLRGHLPPTTCPVAMPDESATFALGDFNHDGFLDIFISGAKSNELWENDGKALFKPVAAGSGSLAYKSTPGASACLATDLNHDGRPDLCVLYPAGEMAYHFNRGFGCFGEEGELRLDCSSTGFQPVSPRVGNPCYLIAEGDAAAPGQVAAAVADFNGDGALDLAVAFADGQVRCFYSDSYSRSMVRLGLAKGMIGPITASVWCGQPYPRCLGAVSLAGSGLDAVVPLGGTGEFQVRWTSPGNPGRTRKVAVPQSMPDDGIRVMLDP